MSLIVSTFQGRYARNYTESRHPSLWKNLLGVWSPGVGRQGMRLLNLAQNRYNGTLTNMTAADVAGGRRGAALNYDGTNNYTSLGDIKELDGISASSWSLWICPKSPSTLKQIWGKWSSGANDGFTIHVGTISATSVLVGGWSGLHYAQVDAVIPNNTWTHLLAWFDGSGSGNSGRLKLFVNGRPVGLSFAGTIPATMPTLAVDARLGADEAGARLFTGLIGEALLWTRPLGVSEIQLLASGLSPLMPKRRALGFVPSSGAISGATTLTFGAAGALTARGALVGTTTLTFGGTAPLTGKGRQPGTTTLTFGSAGVVTAKGALVGTTTLSFTSTGSMGVGMAGTTSLNFGTAATISSWRLVGRPFLYTAANWNASSVFYLEAELKATSGTVLCALWNETDNLRVTSPQLSTVSTSYVRARTSAMTLINGKTYRAAFGSTVGAGAFKSATLIVV